MIRIKHNYLPQIYVPLLAIENNIDFICSEPYPDIITADNVVCRVALIEYVNPLSEKGREIIKDIYKIEVGSFLALWYKKIEFEGLNFCFITLKRI